MKMRIRYEIESVIVRPEVLAARVGTTLEIDPDRDTESLVEYRDNKADAMQRAKEIYQRDAIDLQRSCWGQVIVQEEHYCQPYEQYPQIWEWQAVGESESID